MILLGNQFLGKKNANWIDDISKIVENYNKRIHSSAIRTQVQASIKSNENEVSSRRVSRAGGGG